MIGLKLVKRSEIDRKNETIADLSQQVIDLRNEVEKLRPVRGRDGRFVKKNR